MDLSIGDHIGFISTICGCGHPFHYGACEVDTGTTAGPCNCVTASPITTTSVYCLACDEKERTIAGLREQIRYHKKQLKKIRRMTR